MITSSAKVENQKRTQKVHFNQKGLSNFEITRPHGTGRLYEFFIGYKMRSMAQLVDVSFPGQSLLNVCSGSGMEAEYFAQLEAQVVALDISPIVLQGAKERARRFGFPLKTIAGDAECLPFKSESFDFVFVHDGLHHLPEPEKAIKEMARVARKGIFFTEPADAFITRIAVKFGLSADYEEAGNFVYRLHPRKLRDLFSEIGLSHARFKRYAMWYTHHPSWWFRLFENRIMLGIFKFFFYTGNALFGQFGNKLVAVARKEKVEKVPSGSSTTGVG